MNPPKEVIDAAGLVNSWLNKNPVPAIQGVRLVWPAKFLWTVYFSEIGGERRTAVISSIEAGTEDEAIVLARALLSVDAERALESVTAKAQPK